ncbi:MAG: hypothetical protein JWM82_2220 [Myxococcales bacterium]|nr:hypothetical protein [Myxococcales bacterium]
MIMTRGRIRALGGLSLAIGLIYSAACGNTVQGKDCKVTCNDVETACVQKCTDDACKTKCASDLDNCSASCSTVTVAQPDGG